MSKSSLKDKVFKYFAENPINEGEKGRYDGVKAQFDLNRKQASAYYIQYRDEVKSSPVDVYNFGNFSNSPVSFTEKQTSKILNQSGNELSVDMKTDSEVKTLEDLLIVTGVDEQEWEVKEWSSRKWDVKNTNADKTTSVIPLFSISAKFKKRDVESDLELQKQVILSELFDSAPYSPKRLITQRTSRGNQQLLELALFDVHFGKLAHREEVGEDYDLNIASERYITAVTELVSRVNFDNITKILFPIGQDLINIDNIEGKTTAGTPQDTDSRFHKIVKTVKNVLISTVDALSLLAPVDIVITVGNHDEQTSFMIGEMLDAYYHNNGNVNVYNEASLRKYYKFGISSIMFTHGNRERFQDLGMLFAAENPQLWAETKQRYIQIGHFHHNKKVTSVQAQEFQGFQVQIMPSISGSDAWHRGKGYHSIRQAKAFLFDYEDGLVGEFSHTVK